MDKLIEALRIFEKYMEEDYQKEYPFHCEHDVLYINLDNSVEMSQKDEERLEELGFHKDEDVETWASFKYGSC